MHTYVGIFRKSYVERWKYQATLFLVKRPLFKVYEALQLLSNIWMLTHMMIGESIFEPLDAILI